MDFVCRACLILILTVVVVCVSELLYDRGNPYEMIQLVKELDPAGEITSNKSYTFEFGNCPKNYETYNGHNVRLRYYLQSQS